MTSMNVSASWNLGSLRFLLLVWVASACVAKDARAEDDPASVPPWPLVHILATDPCASEAGGDTATFTVFRTGTDTAALTVHYRLAGTAINGVDYAELAGELIIPANACSAPITVAPLVDRLIEGVETIAVFLEQPAVWPPPYVVCWPSFALGHLEDGDVAPTNRPPVVRISNPPDGSVFLGPVDIRLVAQASDPDGRVRTVEFFDGTTSLGIVSNRPPIVRPVPMVEDALELAVEQDPLAYPDVELDANVDVAIVRPTGFTLLWKDVPAGGHALVAVATDNQGASTRSELVHIRVTDPPPQVLVDVRATDPLAAEPDPAGDRLNTATFTIHRSGSTDLPLTVFYRLGGTAENGADYAELPHSVTIPRGSSTADVVIEPRDDKLVEGPEGVVLRIIAPPCIAIFPPPPGCYAVGAYESARAIINDNDAPPNQPPIVEVVRPLDGSVFLAPADIVLIAAARDFDGRVVTVEFFAGAESLGIVTNHPNLLTASLPPFALKWPDVSAGHYLLTAQATDNGGAVSRSKPIEVQVVERALPPVVTIEATDPEAAEGSANSTLNTATFSVKRTGPTERSLVVFYKVGGTAENGVDYQILSGHVLIPGGSASAPIVVEPIDDRLVEGPETVGVTLAPSLCLVAAVDSALLLPDVRLLDCYQVGAEDHARAVIRDNDVAPSNSPPKVVIIHPEDGNIFVGPTDIRLCAEAKDAEGFVRTVEFFADGTSLGMVTNPITAAVNAGIEAALIDPVFCLAWRDVLPGGYTLTAEATDNRGLTSVSDPVRIKVIEGHRLPVVTITARDPFASEGELSIDPIAFDATPGAGAEGEAAVEFIGPPILVRPNVAVFSVRRDRGTNQPLTVHYRLDGTAENERDYRKLDGAVTIPAGAWHANLVIDPVEDNLVEGTETVIASLEPIACPRILPPPPECYLLGEPARALAYIRDNDSPNRPPHVEIAKPASEAIFLAPADIEIVARVSDSDGYVTEVEFFEGTNSIGKETRVYIVAPPPGEIHEFSMIWSNVPPGRYLLSAKATDAEGASSRSEPVPVRVVSPCVLPIVTIEATDRRATEHDPRLDIVSDTAAFKVTRSCRTDRDLKVRYEVGGTARNGEDYRKLDGELLIPAGSDSAEILVDPIDDELREGPETVAIKLLEVVCVAVDPAPDGCYLVGTPAQDSVVILDNETFPPRVAIVRPDTGERFKLGAPISIVVQAADVDGWVGRVEFFADDRSIGVEEIYFLVPPPPGQLQRFSMMWSNAPAGRHVLTARATDDRGVSSDSGPIGIEVVDHSLPAEVNIFAVDSVAREGAPVNPAVFRVRRSGDTDAPLTVHYVVRGTASNGVDYALLPGSVSIAAGRRTARIVIEPIDDRRPEPVETVIVRLEQAAIYNVGRWGRAGAVLVDNEHPRLGTVCLADHNLFVRWDGPDAGCYRIELSDDLGKWECTDANHVVDGVIHFVDPEASELKRRFYRVRPAMDVEVFGEDE